jgi:UDP-perosamine 4-acetyltransferase
MSDRKLRPWLLFGSGGLGVMVLDIVVALDPGNVERVLFVDENPAREGQQVHGIPVLGSLYTAAQMLAEAGIEDIDGTLCIAGYAGRKKTALAAEATLMGLRWASAIHPRAVVSPLADEGVGVVVLPGAVVDPEARLGDHAIVNKNATVGHNCQMERYAQLGPGTTSGGLIGEGAFVGMSACVLPGIHVGEGSVVGAGSVVTRDVAPFATVVGSPARPV